MNQTRLAWEPESLVSAEKFERIAWELTDGRGDVTLLRNGTMLFVKKNDDDEAEALQLSKLFPSFVNFSVFEVDVGGFMVAFDESLGVYVGANEFSQRKDEIYKRRKELIFPGEGRLKINKSTPEHHKWVGIYGRGKLQRDVHNFQFLKRL